MSEYVSICRTLSRPEEIDLFIDSKRTYLSAKLVCSFSADNADVFTYHSERFNLYEGLQCFVIRHPFSRINAHSVRLLIKIVDQEGIQVGAFCRDLQAEYEPASPSLINVTGDVVRVTEGGKITVEIAGISFKIETHYNDNLPLFEKYITAKESVYDISIDEKEIREEKELLNRTEKYPPSEAAIEMYCLRRIVDKALVNHHCFQIHGAAFAVDQCGYIFTADSGTGKTTHMRLWLDHLKNAYVVNGDHPIVKVGQNIMVCGSPWCGKEGLNTNTAVPLKAIVIMERSAENSIVEISLKEALIELLRQVYRPEDSDKMAATLHLLSMLEGKVRFYRFKFNNFADDAFSVPYRKIHLNQ